MSAIEDQESPTPLRDQRRQKLLTAIVCEVPFSGWRVETLAAAARSLDQPPAHSERLFPGGVSEVLEFWSHQLDAAMVAWLGTDEAKTLRTTARAEAAIMLRLQLLMPHREAARLAMNRLSFPHGRGGTVMALNLVSRTVDEVWLGLGDRSTDFNWYSKRLLLAGVYLPTIGYWLSSSAPDMEDTQEFLHRQMERVLSASSFGKDLMTRVSQRMGSISQSLGNSSFIERSRHYSK